MLCLAVLITLVWALIIARVHHNTGELNLFYLESKCSIFGGLFLISLSYWCFFKMVWELRSWFSWPLFLCACPVQVLGTHQVHLDIHRPPPASILPKWATRTMELRIEATDILFRGELVSKLVARLEHGDASYLQTQG